MRLIDLTGQKFGRLTVIERAYPNTKNNRIKWLCKCECGKEKSIRAEDLRSGAIKSCGCLKRLSPGLGNMRNIIRAYKNRAKRRGLEYKLTDEQFAKITQQNCYYCGAKPNQIAKQLNGNGEYIYNGLDRTDNTKGYTIDNIVSCCGICNMAKQKLTIQEFDNWIEKIYKKRFGERNL
jgi:hypothetical protein